jgi:hypothetical protein
MKNTTQTVLFPVIILFLILLTASAEGASEKIKEISAPEVKDMLEKSQAVLVHTLSKTEFEMQHIPDSINIPINVMETTKAFPGDKAVPLIFYGMGKS